MYALLPPQRKHELTQVQNGLVYLQTELTRGLSGDDLRMYQEVIRRADREPSLRLVESEERSKSWSSKNLPLTTQVPLTVVSVGALTPVTMKPPESVNVKRCLESFLPGPCMEVIRSGQIGSLQGIMNDSNVAVKDFFTFFGGTERGRRAVKSFHIIRLSDWNDPKIEIYYVNLEARFDSTRALWMHEDKVSLRAEYKKKVYSASRDGLLSRLVVDPYVVQMSVQSWLNGAITY